MYLLGNILEEGIAGIMLVLDTIIYGLISGAYKIFMALASARLLTSDAYTQIANSLYAIVGVVMLFVLAYAVIRTIMDPDQATKGELSGGNLVKGIAIAVIGLALTPTIFEYLYQAQGLFVEHDVIGRIFFRNFDNNEIDLGAAGVQTSPDDSCQDQDDKTAQANCYVKSIGGAVAATSIWSAFFYPSNPCDSSGGPEGCKSAEDITVKAEDFKNAGWALVGAGVAVGILAVAAANIWNPVGWVIGGLLAVGALFYAAHKAFSAGDDLEAEIGSDEISLADAYAMSSSGNGFGVYTGFLWKYQSDGEITYLWGVSTLCGIFALYAFVSFSIDMGVRAAKLAYYQIIAPIPMVLQILPKFKKNFTSYITNLFQTFMEVFIRISVVYIVVYIICHLTDMFSTNSALWRNQDLNWAERGLALALLIMGLIIFAKDAPKVITESLGIQGGMGDFKSLSEKLSKGGFFGAASIARSAKIGAMRGWNDDRDGKNKPWNRLGRAITGGLGSTARNAWSQVGTPGHQFADKWKEGRDAAYAAADATDVAREKTLKDKAERKDAKEKHKADRANLEAFRALKEKMETAGHDPLTEEEKNLLKNLGLTEAATDDEMDKKLQELEQNVKVSGNIRRKYAFHGKVMTRYEDLMEQMTPVSDPKEAKAKVEFAGKMKKNNGALRDLAYEEPDTLASQKYQEWQQESKKKVSRYRDGWDDDSIREEATARRRRIDSANSAEMSRMMDRDIQALGSRMSALTAGKSAEEAARIMASDDYKALQQRKDELDSRRSSLSQGVTLSNEIATLQTKLAGETDPTKKADFENQIAAKTAELQTFEDGIRASYRAEVNTQVDFEYKMSDSEFAVAQAEHAKKVKSLKEQAEAAADMWIFEESQKSGSKVANLMSTQFADSIAYVREHAHERVIIGEDRDGKPITEEIGKIFQDMYGKEAYQAGQYSPTRAREGSYASSGEFTYGDGKKVYMRRGVKGYKNGQPEYTDGMAFYSTPAPAKDQVDGEPTFKSQAEFIGSYSSPIGGVKALTPTSRGGKTGSDAEKYTNILELGPLQQRAMQTREKREKKGDK